MERAKLRVPIKVELDDTLPEATVDRLWQAIDGASPRHRPRRAAPRIAWALALASALLLGWIAWPAPGPLRFADRRELPAMLVASTPTQWALDDGSRLHIARDAQLEVMQSTGSSIVLGLRSGRVTFDIEPGGPRVWKIECGSASVEVVGTRFGVDRRATSLRVWVERGAVVVRGERVPDRAVRLAAGQSLLLEHPVPVPVPVPALRTPSANAPPNPAAPRPVQPRAAATRSKALDTSAEALLAAADAQLREGRHAAAAQQLERLLREHPGDPRAPLAQFTLARLSLDAFDAPARAAELLGSALTGGLPAALREDARARLVEAEVRRGDLSAARREAERYRNAHPNGRHSAAIERWVQRAP